MVRICLETLITDHGNSTPQPAPGNFVLVALGGGQALPRAFHSATIVDNKIYVFGGETVLGRTDLVEEIDLVAGTRLAKAPLPFPWAEMTSAAVNGKIYVFSGVPGAGSMVEEYDPYFNQWLTCGVTSPVEDGFFLYDDFTGTNGDSVNSNRWGESVSSGNS